MILLLMILYQIIIFVVTAFAIIHGFRRGFACQVPSAVGTAFGIVCARIFMVPAMGILREAFPSHTGCVEDCAFYGVCACIIVFFMAYGVFTVLTSFTGRVLAGRPYNVVSHICGALFTLFKWLLFLSLAYNFILALTPRSELLRAGKSDDGNAVELVMLMGSSILGFESVETLAHKVQIEDAKKISQAKFSIHDLDNSRFDCKFA